MAYRKVPRTCLCCGESFMGGPKQHYKDEAHYRRSDTYKNLVHVGSAASKAKRDAQRHKMTLAGFGRLTPRELAIYKAAHRNGWSAGYDCGRRKGYAEALHEDMEGTWTKARRAA